MIIVLDNIRSLHNVGSIFRTADAAAVEKLYLCGFTPSPLDRLGKARSQITKTALGAESTVPWEKVKTTAGVITKLKKQGYKIIAVEQAPGALPYYALPTTHYALERLVLVFGHEVEGVSNAALGKADTIIEIPMSGKKESLNVSVAVGIILFHLRDRLRK